MNIIAQNRTRLKRVCFGLALVFLCLLLLATRASAQITAEGGSQPQLSATATHETFATPQQAAEALITAAENYDVARLRAIFGPDSEDIVSTGEPARDREMARDFAAKAREKMNVSAGPKGSNRAYLVIGKDDWPFPVPIASKGNRSYFDSRSGRQEILYRRIGRNELDAIEVCRGYVEAQYEYAFEKREGYSVHQYAQRIVSTPGKQDGLAWRNEDGSWAGPIGKTIALAIEQGYNLKAEPYHGYFFKILKGQGPAAPLGRIDYVIEGAMIGGFALVAAPAGYRVTGVKTFMVSQNGVVYQKDFGENTLDAFKQMDLFNPDKTWIPVLEQ